MRHSMKIDNAPEWATRLREACDALHHDAVVDPLGVLCVKGRTAYRLGHGVFGCTTTPFVPVSEDGESITWKADADSGRKVRLFATPNEAAEFIIGEFRKVGEADA